MLRPMATHDENTEEFEDELEETETGTDDIRQLIRDEIEKVLRSTPGEQNETGSKTIEDEEPLSLRAVESSVRRIVEEAMIPLREAQKKPVKKAAPKKEPEAAPEPAETKPTRKLSEFLWGQQ